MSVYACSLWRASLYSWQAMADMASLPLHERFTPPSKRGTFPLWLPFALLRRLPLIDGWDCSISTALLLRAHMPVYSFPSPCQWLQWAFIPVLLWPRDRNGKSWGFHSVTTLSYRIDILIILDFVFCDLTLHH